MKKVILLTGALVVLVSCNRATREELKEQAKTEAQTGDP